MAGIKITLGSSGDNSSSLEPKTSNSNNCNTSSNSITWTLDDSVFESRTFLAMMNTASARSPINANEVVWSDIKNAMADYNPYCQYVLNITEEGDSGNRLFGDPKLCYFKVDLISKPMMDLSKMSKYFGVVGKSLKLEERDIIKNNISIAADGCLYIKPFNEEPMDTILIPSVSNLHSSFVANQLINLYSEKAILDYSFVFNVRPTLYGVYRYFKNVFSDFASVDPVIYKKDKSEIKEVKEIEGFIAKIRPLIAEGWRGYSDNLEEEIVKVLEAFGINGSFDTSTLSNLYLNIPFHFKIDPFARVSSRTNNGI